MAKINLEKWIDEDGENVDIYCLLSGKIYVDKIAKELKRKYDLTSCSDYILPKSLGKFQYEEDVRNMLGLCKLLKNVVGLAKEDWDNLLIVAEPLDETTQGSSISFEKSNYFRKKNVMGKEIIFLTEELLINQGVKLRKR